MALAQLFGSRQGTLKHVGSTSSKPLSPAELLTEAYGPQGGYDPFLASFGFDDAGMSAPASEPSGTAANPIKAESCAAQSTLKSPSSEQEMLLGDQAELQSNGRQFCYLPLPLIHPNPNSPRSVFKPEELEELAQSIRKQGLLQPLIVRPRSSSEFEIVVGERRRRAAQLAEIREVPVLIRPINDAEALEIALVENVQRSNLNPLEEAQGYAQLIKHYGYSQHEVAMVVGKSRSHVANAVRLLTLPDEVKAHLESGRLTAGHARTLIAAGTPVELANEIIERSLNVRESERLANSQQASSTRDRKVRADKKRELRDLEHKVSEALGFHVDIVGAARSGGRFGLHVRTFEQLSEVCRRLARQD